LSASHSQYSLPDYDFMFADPLRTPAYLAAIAQVVRPGDVVVEIGAGTGYFSVAAARAGARMVYAIERGPVVALTQEIVRENGCSERIRVIRGDAATAELPERGDILLFDLSGWLPLNADAISCIISARERLVHPDARLISARDRIYAAPCSAPRGWAEVELTLGPSPHGISRLAASRLAHSTVRRERVDADQLLGDAGLVAELDYRTIASPDVEAELEWRITRDGELHGIICWFETHLAPGVGFSTGPGAPPNVYGQPFLPLERKLDVRAGDVLRARLRFRLYGSGYLYAWDTTLTPAAGRGEPVEMKQSTLGATLAASDVTTFGPLAGKPDLA
jgi:SAM-dependent methyltransferase